MNEFESLGFFDFEDFVEELTDEQLFAINGGSCAGGAPSGGYGPTGGGSCGGGYNPGPSNPTYGGSCGGGGAVTPSNPYPTPTPACGGGYHPNAYDNMKKSIKENIVRKKYIKGSYMCDNWTQEVLKEAGVDINDYYAGDADSFTCEQHIAKMKNKGYTTKTPETNGVYVVLMNEGHEYTKPDKTKGVLAAHTGFLVIGDGDPYFIDNSSGNSNKGVAKTYGYINTAPSVMSKFGYDAFYYKKVQ